MAQAVGRRRCADGRQGSLQEMNGFRSMPRSVAEAQGKVQAIACYIDPVVVDQKTQVDQRVPCPKLVQILEQPSVCESAVASDRDNLLDLAVLQPVKGRPDPLERLRENGHQHQPFVRESETARQ